MNRLISLRGVDGVRTCLVVTAVAWFMLAGVAKAVTVAPPSITGTAQEGKTLTVVNGAASTTTATITDQWELCTPGCAPIAGQTGPTYTVASGNVGHTIAVVETATDATSPPSPAATPSAQTAAVLPLPPTNSTAPVITGIAQPGQTLTVAPGTWTSNPAAPTTLSRQWEHCVGTVCAAIPGQTASTYVVTAGDIGHTIDVLETASALATPLATVRSVATAVVLAPPTTTAAPTISGTPQQGQTLTVTQAAWTNGPTSVTDQWEDCLGAVCAPIPGQNGPSYTLGAGDVGHTIQVLETAATAAGPGPSAASSPTGTVTATSTTSVVAVPASAPMANQSVTLVATVISGSGNANPAGSMTFLNAGTAINGCTGMGVKGGQSSTVACQASFPAGTPLITAAYVPGPGSLVDGSTSAPTAVTIGRDPTSISLAVTTRVSRGGRATYSATVVLPVSNSGPAAPTGSMRFFDRGHAIPACVDRQLTNLTATCTVKYLRRGTHHISALYTGDANFMSSSSPARFVKIVSAAPTVTGFVKSTLQWTFFYHPKYTQVILLRAFQIVRGTDVLLTCLGDGCPFARFQIPGAGGDSINLLPEFGHHRLRAGTQVTILLTHPHWVGKYYSFTMRAGRPPRIGMRCLAVGRVTPGVGC